MRLKSLFTVRWHYIRSAVYASQLFPFIICPLPFSLLRVQEGLQDANLGLQRLQPDLQSLIDLCLIVAELEVEVLSVWACGHGRAEDGLHQEAVVGLEGGGVGIAEGDRQLFAGDLDVLGKGEAGKLEAAGKIVG